MKKTVSLTFISLIILITAVQLYAEDETIKIGALFSVSGRTAFLGIPEKETVEMLVEQINEKGGINGKKVEVIIYDITCN